MDEAKHLLVNEATRKFKTIQPCGKCASIWDSFTVEENKLFFWFNTKDNSTHMLVAEIA